MIGHRNERYGSFGTAAARADDVANLVPSRLTAVLTAAAAPVADGSPGRATWTWLRDGRKHPSPNAGQCEAAMAGALGVQLGGANVYFGRREVRPTLGDGPAPAPPDIGRAVGLSAAVGAAAIVLATTYALIRPRRRGRQRRPTR
jgi:adenosylcobinamide-phosphate synthase